MINLLPPKEKEELLLEKQKRLVIVLGAIALIALICLVLVLFSLKFYVLAHADYYKTMLGNNEKISETPDILTFKDLVKKYNKTLVTVDTFYKKEIYFSDILKTVLNIQKPKGIYFDNLTIKALKEENKVGVAISGLSDTRDNLLLFKDYIEQSQKTSNVYFPPDNWIKPVNINFYLTFEIKNGN